MTPIHCVFYKQTPYIRRFLRRYISADVQCPHDYGDGYKRCCDARVVLDDIEPVKTEEGYIPSYQWRRDDPRWPKQCEGCGREFPQDMADNHTAPWQVHVDYLYERSDGVRVALRDLPVGAIWYQDFGHGPHSEHLLERHFVADVAEAQKIEIPHLFVRTPGGVWDMDTKSSNGTGWRVSGEVPKITASPSIQHDRGNRWHGWLKDGILTDA